MKKRKILIFTALIAILIVFALTSCVVETAHADKKVSQISADGIDTYYYFLGDEIVIDEGAVLYVVYEDGTIDTVPLTKSMIDSSFNTDSAGIKNVKVNYKGVSAYFEIEVLDLIIESVLLVEKRDGSNNIIAKKEYTEYTKFDVTGLELAVSFVGGRIVTVPVLSNMITRFDSTYLGPQTVEITYRSQKLYYQVTIISKVLVSIAVGTLPTAKTVFIGKELNPAGMVYNFTYNNYQVIQVPHSDVASMITFSFNNSAPSPSATVTVTYKPTSAQTFTATFKIQVLAKNWTSMRIIQAPVTKGILLSAATYTPEGLISTPELRSPSTALNNILQGDTINFDTGKIEITFDDGSKEEILMSNHLIKVYNQRTVEKAEISGFAIEVSEERDVPAGDYYLKYNTVISGSEYIYDTNPTVRVSVRDSSGNAVAVSTNSDGKQLFEVKNAQSYVVTVTGTVDVTTLVNGQLVTQTLVTNKSYAVYAVNAVTQRRTLDISSAGEYELTVIYSENEAWSIPLHVKVVSRAPQTLELRNTAEVTNRIYVVGENVNIAFVQYRVVYNNGNTDPWQPVTAKMLTPECTLSCAEPSSVKEKRIIFTSYGLTSQTLIVQVDPVKVVSAILEPPTNNYILLNGSVKLDGGYITAYMNNNTRTTYSLLSLYNTGAVMIENDPLSGDNSIASNDAYTGHIVYSVGGSSMRLPFEYYVVQHTVVSLDLRTDFEKFKDTYFENEEINFQGLSMRATWSDNSITDVPITKSMLYRYTLGDSAITLRYMGITVSYSVYIIRNEIVKVEIASLPRTVYFEADRLSALDLAGIRIMRTYSNGNIDYEIGITLSGSGDLGWFFLNKNEVHFSGAAYYDVEQNVILAYRYYVFNQISKEYEITQLTVSYKIKLVNRVIKKITIYDPTLPVPPEGNLLCNVSRGLPLNLYGKRLYIEYEYGTGGSTISSVALTSDMVQYSVNDLTVGLRNVIINYNGTLATVMVNVTNTYLSELTVISEPKNKYMLTEALDLSGGMIRRTFKSYDVYGPSWTDEVPMSLGDKTESEVGFNSHLNESAFIGGLSYVTQTITIEHFGKQYSVDVRIYKKFNASVNYYSTISFYGDVAQPYATITVNVAGFTTPFFTISYINSKNLLTSLPDGAQRIDTTDSENNLLYSKYYIKVNGIDRYYLQVIGEEDIIYYVDETLITSGDKYPTSPAALGEKHIILIQIRGNKYYNPSNYASKELKIINRFIEVVAAQPNEDAVVWTVKTSDNERAAYLVSVYIERKLLGDPSISITLGTPLKTSFEIIVSNFGNNTEAAIRQDIINAIEQEYFGYYIYVTDALGNVSIKTTESKTQISGSHVVEGSMVRYVVTINEFTRRQGVNVRAFSESAVQENLSFFIQGGGLIAICPSRFFVIELFNGNLVRVQGNDVRYRLTVSGEVKSGFEMSEEDYALAHTVSGYGLLNYDGTVETLPNPNYFITFKSADYLIKPREVRSILFNGAAWSGALGYNVIYGYASPNGYNLNVFYYVLGNNVQNRINYDQIRIYKQNLGGGWDLLERNALITEAGTYKAEVCYNYVASAGYENNIKSERVCLIILQ